MSIRSTVGVARVDIGEAQCGIERLDRPADESFGRIEARREIGRGETDRQVDPIGRDPLEKGLLAADRVGAAARQQFEPIGVGQVAFGDAAGDAADAVAAHFGFGAVGVEHAHTEPVVAANGEQQPVRGAVDPTEPADEVGAVGERFELRFGRRVEQQKAVARAVAAYVVGLQHLRLRVRLCGRF